jgi:DNA-3-methyladenine glycosylase II
VYHTPTTTSWVAFSMLPLRKLTEFHSLRTFLIMPVTRSHSRSTAGGLGQQPIPKPPKPGRKRDDASGEVVEPPVGSEAPRKKTRAGKQPVPVADVQPVGTVAVPGDPGTPPVLVPAELSFSFEEAKRHLIAADSRFQDVFDTAVCTPYQKLDRVEPFR